MTGLLILFGTALAILIVLLTTMLVRGMTRPPRHAAGYAIGRGMAVDPGEMGLEFTAWNLDRPDGAVLPVWEIKGKAGNQRTGATAVFVHGWGHGRVDSLARVEAFLPHFERIVLYDLRGHGESTGGLSRLGDGEQEDLIALIDRLGGGSFVLIGHSMGAVIAIHAAMEMARNPSIVNAKIDGVIAYGPYCEFHRSLIGRLKYAGQPGRPMTDLALLALRLRGIVPLSVRERELKALGVPMLIVHGKDDIVSPLAHAQRIAAAAPNARLIEIEGGGHTDAHRIDATTHATAIEAFIRDVGPSASMTTCLNHGGHGEHREGKVDDEDVE